MRFKEFVGDNIFANLLKAQAQSFAGEIPSAADIKKSVDSEISQAMGTDGSAQSSEPAEASKVVVVGDSLAVGTGSKIPGAVVDAKVGINSKAVLEKATSNKNLQGADVAVISAGANDGAGASGNNPSSPNTISNLQGIRSALKAKKYVWILPYNKSVANDIKSAASPGDEFVDLSKTVDASKDKVHPSNYAPVAKSAIDKGGIQLKKPSKSGGTSKGGKNFVSPGDMKKYLAGKGLDTNSIAGLLANAKAESSFNAGAYIASDAGQGQSGGLFGFHDPVNGRGEFTNMVKACGPNWQSNWQGQLDYALSASRYPKTGFKSPGAAAEWFVRNYERPKYLSKEIASRSQAATQYA